MKKLLLVLLLGIGYQTVFAQTTTDTALYLKYPVIPVFKLTNMADSSVLTKDKLSSKKATMVMIFSPECEHCHYTTGEILKHIDKFRNIQILMVSREDYDFIKQFYNEFKLGEHPNIIVGRDPSYFLGTFYRVRAFPSIYLYDKKGNFVKFFDGSEPVEKIPDAL